MKKIMLILLAAVAFMTLKSVTQAFPQYSLAIYGGAAVLGVLIWFLVQRGRSGETGDE